MNRRDAIKGAAALTAASGLLNLPAAGATMREAPARESAPPAFTGLTGRPPASSRRFRSPVVERTIEEMRKATGSPELAAIFANCFPNTLDTTVFPGTAAGKPDTFVITGDIDAMWLRDSSAQMWVYLPFAKEDAALGTLIEGVVRRQARLVLLDSYANAFKRDPAAKDLEWSTRDATDRIPGVAERKWEIDSLCYVVRLAHGFWKTTGSITPFDQTWQNAAQRIVRTFREQQRKDNLGPYHFQRAAQNPTDSLPLGGYGNPVRPNGLICSGFRPSDDACVYPFFIPANLFAVAALRWLAEMATQIHHDAAFAQECEQFAAEVQESIQRAGILAHPTHGEIYAYEVDGYGNTLAMDDANAPGLLSLAYLGIVPEGAAAQARYRRTRAYSLSDDNPYFFQGKAGEGVGGPHIGLGYIWPMSILMRALTSNDDAEISTCLQTLCSTTAGTDFMHESFQKDDAAKYTRSWFAWANGLFGELLLKLKRERPALLRDFRVKN